MNLKNSRYLLSYRNKETNKSRISLVTAPGTAAVSKLNKEKAEKTCGFNNSGLTLMYGKKTGQGLHTATENGGG